jgi:hypothetical protein
MTRGDKIWLAISIAWVVWMLTLALGCATIPPAPPVPPPVQAYRAVGLDVYDQDGTPVQGALCRLQDTPGWQTATTDAHGYLAWLAVTVELRDTQLECSAPTFAFFSEHRELATGENENLASVLLTPLAVRGKTWAETGYLGRGRVYGLQDAGRDVFDISYNNLDAPARRRWLDLKRSNGDDYLVLGPVSGYPGYWVPGVDLRADPVAATFFVREVIDAGFRVRWFATTGDGGTATDIAQYWDGYDQEFTRLGLKPWIEWSNGWEVYGPGGGWTSKQVSDGFLWAHAHGYAIAAHGQPGRWSPASNPLEADDPWQGYEPGSWTSAGGEYVNVVLYQSPHGSELLDPSNRWLDRWHDGVMRLGCGQVTWRVIPIEWFETTWYDQAHGTCPDCTATAKRLNQTAATDAQQTCGAGIGFGTWVP